MRVLLVSHNFLPAHAAGTEVYTGQLALELAARGHDVRVFTTEKDVARADLSIVRRTWQGLEVTELTNNLFYRSFRETWDNPAIDERFAAELERERPDLVHFQHLLYLSIGCVEAAARAGLPIVFTLHDFWLHCARFGQRIHADGTLCERIDFARCGSCLAGFKFAQGTLERTTGRVIAALQTATGLDVSRAAKRAARELGLAGPKGAAPLAFDPARAAEMEGAVAERDAAMRARVVPRVQRFLSPSRFLRERFVEWGIPAERIEFVRTGIDLAQFPSGARAARAGSALPLRVAFVGTLAPHKGPQLLLEAWGLLRPELRACARLELFGPAQQEPGFQALLVERSAAVGAELRGALPRGDVARTLAALDLLVVPSVWYENSPLVILEALALRTPVLVSAIGGMAELIEPGRTGEHFRVGDARDLARALGELLADPRRLAAYYTHDEPVKDVVQDALQMEEIYFRAIEAARTEAERGA